MTYVIHKPTDLEGEDEEGVPQERDGVALPGLHSLEALVAHVAEDVFGVVGEGEEHGQQPRQQHAVDEDRHRACVGLFASGEAEVREEDGGEPYPFPEDRL